MGDKTFRRLLIALVAVCLALTVAHAVYAFFAYQNSSIIYFITREWW